MRALLLALLAVLVAGCDGAEPAADARPAHEPRAFMPEQRPAAETAAATGRFEKSRIVRPVRMRARPGGRRLARLRTRTEFGSPKVVPVLRRRSGWLRVQAPELPNHRAGWIPARAARVGHVDVSIHVDRSRRTLTVRRAGRVVRRLRVAVG